MPGIASAATSVVLGHIAAGTMTIRVGASIIFREGLYVTGLNTEATLWCSAAVGLLAGSGHPLHAALATAFVVLVNLTLRPLVRIINRQPISQAEIIVILTARA